MRKSKCQIITEGYGKVMSAATLILAAGKKRRISELCWFMHHEMSADPGSLRASELDAYNAQVQKEMMQLASWMSKFTKKSRKFWLTQGTHIDVYFDAKQLVKFGVADEIF